MCVCVSTSLAVYVEVGTDDSPFPAGRVLPRLFREQRGARRCHPDGARRGFVHGREGVSPRPFSETSTCSLQRRTRRDHHDTTRHLFHAQSGLVQRHPEPQGVPQLNRCSCSRLTHTHTHTRYQGWVSTPCAFITSTRPSRTVLACVPVCVTGRQVPTPREPTCRQVHGGPRGERDLRRRVCHRHARVNAPTATPSVYYTRRFARAHAHAHTNAPMCIRGHSCSSPFSDGILNAGKPASQVPGEGCYTTGLVVRLLTHHPPTHKPHVDPHGSPVPR